MLIEGWKNYLSDVAVPLLALETDPQDQAAAAALARGVAQAGYLLKYSSLLAPDTLAAAMQVRRVTRVGGAEEGGGAVVHSNSTFDHCKPKGVVHSRIQTNQPTVGGACRVAE